MFVFNFVLCVFVWVGLGRCLRSTAVTILWEAGRCSGCRRGDVVLFPCQFLLVFALYTCTLVFACWQSLVDGSCISCDYENMACVVCDDEVGSSCLPFLLGFDAWLLSEPHACVCLFARYYTCCRLDYVENSEKMTFSIRLWILRATNTASAKSHHPSLQQAHRLQSTIHPSSPVTQPLLLHLPPLILQLEEKTNTILSSTPSFLMARLSGQT